ncbi:hypothetical protein D3C86_2005310 [compost metagenome]
MVTEDAAPGVATDPEIETPATLPCNKFSTESDLEASMASGFMEAIAPVTSLFFTAP